MPFNPPQTPNLLPILFQHAMNQRAQEEARAYRQSEEKKAQREMELHQLLQLAQNPDIKLDAFGPFFEHLGPEDFAPALQVQKVIKKQKTEAEQLGQATNPQALSAASELQAPVLNERGQLAPNPMAAQGQSAITSSLADISRLRPELVPGVQRNLDLIRAAKEDKVRRQQAATRFARSEQQGQLAETRTYARGQELLDSTTQRIAETLAAGQSYDPEAIRAELVDKAGVSPSFAEKTIAEAEYRARGAYRTIQRTEKGATGKRAEVLLGEAEANSIRRDFPEFTDNAYIQEGVTRMIGGTAIRAPLAEDMLGRPVFISVSGKAEATKVREQQRAMMSMQDQFDALRSAFTTLRQSGQAGPLQSAKWFDALNFVGAQPAEVAAYRNSSLLFAAEILKASQGSRPSDFDFKNYLVLVPALTEVQSGSADAKLDQLAQLMRIQTLASVGDVAARKAIKQQRKDNSPFDRQTEIKLKGLSAQMDAAMASGDTASQEKIAQQVFDLAQTWQTSPNATVPKSSGGGLTPDERQALGF